VCKPKWQVGHAQALRLAPADIHLAVEEDRLSYAQDRDPATYVKAAAHAVQAQCALSDYHTLALQISIVAFKKGQLRVLSHAWDRNVGGRDLDNVLFEYFAKEFQEKYKRDVRTNLRGSFRLRVACEKVSDPP